MLEENVTSIAKIVTLSGDDSIALIEDLSQRAIMGGQVYDAIIAKADESAQVDKLVTLNDAHFRNVWPVGMGKIVSPLTAPPPTP
jgi:hypothetical protein